MACKCKEGAGCFECKPEEVGTDKWPVLVRNRQLDELEEEMVIYKHKYYCEGNPAVTDAQYDLYEDILRRERPTSWILSSVGCPSCGGRDGDI